MNEIIELRGTKSSENWSSLPGNFDTLHTNTLYPSDNEYGIPDLLPHDFIPKDLVMYGPDVRRPKVSTMGKTIHFFLDDYKFEPLWNKPVKTLGLIQRMGYALSPDFSLFTNYPKAVQIWNVYRNRYLARYWQENDVQVIPTLVWSDESSYDFAFKGVPKGGTIAVGTVGLRNPEARKMFCKGFLEMCTQIEPKRLIVYGEVQPLDFSSYIPNVHKYDSYWKKRREEM